MAITGIGSSRISDAALPVVVHRRRLALARWSALVRMEWRTQWRDPLTALYALVLLLLTMGYAASDAVVLVNNRGEVPRTASWAVTLAFGGLTAFAQVITTMITATAVLRDRAQRAHELIATTGLTPVLWVMGRVTAAFVVMLAVYAAIPVGMVLGTTLADGPIAHTVAVSVRTYAIITVPTMLVVTMLLTMAGVYTQRVLGVLVAALVLVGLWQLALLLVGAPATRTVGALLDPFGNAPVVAVTFEWSALDKATRVVPWSGALLANRLLWCSVAAGSAWVLLGPWRARLWSARLWGTPSAADMLPRSTSNAVVPRRVAHTARQSMRLFTAQWLQRDGGWRVVAALAVLNVLANVMATIWTGPDALPTGSALHAPLAVAEMLHVVSGHARLFLILLATVYAGELVWRDRDTRMHELVASMPVSRRDLVLGRVQALIQAQWSIVWPLAAIAMASTGLVVLRHAPPAGDVALVALALWGLWCVFVLWLPLALLTVLSLAVHVLLHHKVAAHLLLITGWVLAVVIHQSFDAPWWLRFAEPAALLAPELGEGATLLTMNWGPLLQRGAYWCTVGAALLCFIVWRWPWSASAPSAHLLRLTSRR